VVPETGKPAPQTGKPAPQTGKTVPRTGKAVSGTGKAERGLAAGEAAGLAIETVGLTKRYRRATALSDCSVAVPQGRISALVGPNGAGKSTLLRLLTGLARPTDGTAVVLGSAPRQDPAFLAGIGYLAQDVPLYRRLSAEDHIRAGARLNRRWNDASARTRLRELGVPLDRAVGKLSGGQRAQVGLTLALAKQPRLLLLDEPVAALDPLARRHFLSTLATAMVESEGSLTVVLSSHLITDLERVCDHLILLTESRVQLCGDIDELLAGHAVLVGPRKDTAAIERTHTVVYTTTTPRQSTLVIRRGGPVIDPAYEAEDISLEDLVLAYMGAAAPAAYAHLSTVGEEQ
jgi:ABC-2 type transport system ATP-binding protein